MAIPVIHAHVLRAPGTADHLLPDALVVADLRQVAVGLAQVPREVLGLGAAFEGLAVWALVGAGVIFLVFSRGGSGVLAFH